MADPGDDPKPRARTGRLARPAPARAANDDGEETGELPRDLMAFARDPAEAARALERRKGAGPSGAAPGGAGPALGGPGALGPLPGAPRRPSDPLEETDELSLARRPSPRAIPNPPVAAMRPSDSGGGPTDAARLARLLEINRAINHERELGRLLDMLMDAAVELSRARRGFLVLWDRGEMQVVRARNIERAAITSPEAAISRHLIKEAIERRETVVTACGALERDGYASATGLDLKSVAVSPLLSRGRVLGAIYLDEPERVGVFRDDDIRTLEAFCDTAAIALQNARHVAELETRMESQRLRLRRVEAEVRRRDEDAVRRFGNLVTKSPKLKRVFDLLGRVAETAFPVIIQGESGTGKELLAKAIHYTSERRDQPFVSLNCAAVPETLLDSELFGYQAGAFTGAVRGHRGLFEQADKGTLFLDEIEEMSPAMQGKLLRVLQEGEVRRVGGKATVKIDVRVIAASNRDIQAMVETGEFRRDLYYRLNVIPVQIPPLRERLEDLEAIVSDLLERLTEAGERPPEVDAQVLDAFRRYAWPGNIRELENELKRLLALGATQVRLADLDPRFLGEGGPAPRRAGGAGPGDSGSLPTLNIKDLERITIERALQQAGGNKTQAAKVLGLSRRGLLKKLERYRAEGEDVLGAEGVGDDGDGDDDGDD